MNLMVPNISVIVPVHNMERWISQCLDSILSQTYMDFELILVDDGSTDNSRSLCDEYAAKDARIQALHIPNGGVSNARNTGLALAQGRFTCFIDSDDWVDKDYLATLLETMVTAEAQLSLCGIFGHADSHEAPIVWTAPAQILDVSGGRADGLLKLNQSLLFYGPTNKMYERQIIADRKIHFDTALTFGEDLAFNFQYLDFVARIAVSERPLYHYREANPESLSKKYYADKFEIDMRLFEVIYAFFEKKGLLTGAARRWLWTRYFWSLHDCLFLINHPQCNLGLRQKYNRVREIITHPDVAEALAFADTDKCLRSVLACIRHHSALGFFALNILMSLKKRVVPS